MRFFHQFQSLTFRNFLISLPKNFVHSPISFPRITFFQKLNLYIFQIPIIFCPSQQQFMPFPQMNQNISHIFISSPMSFLLFFISRKIKILRLFFIRHFFNHFYQFFKVFSGSHNQICLISRSSHFFTSFLFFGRTLPLLSVATGRAFRNSAFAPAASLVAFVNSVQWPPSALLQSLTQKRKD